MKIPVFELERVQSIYENTVDFNLTESGFHPLTLSELLTPEQIEELTGTVLGYGQTNYSAMARPMGRSPSESGLRRSIRDRGSTTSSSPTARPRPTSSPAIRSSKPVTRL